MKIKYFLGIIFFLSLITGCQEDNLNGISPNGSGEIIGPFTLTVPVNTSMSEVMTRASFDDNSQQKITDLWIGVYDATDHHRIKMFESNGEITGSSHTSLGAITLDELYFNDAHPRIYIAAVANYKDVEGWAAENTEKRSMAKLLQEADTWDKYIGIAADVATVEAINPENSAYAFMSGMYGSAHGNTTVDYNGIPVNNAKNIASLPYHELFTEEFRYNDSNINLKLTGAVHLRKLVSHFTVNVNAGTNIEISEPSFKLYNLPRAVYVQERTMMTDPSRWPYWQGVTPAASDIFGYEDQDDAADLYDIHENERLTGNERIEGNGSFSFGYWHYENKHWATDPNCISYDNREVVYDRSAEKPVFKSLVPEEYYNSGNFINNGATYFILSAYVKDNATGDEGRVNYLIHEGFCCDADGDAAEKLENASKDFSAFRNTNYTFNITIEGLENVIVKAKSDTGSYPNPGATGEIVNISSPDLLSEVSINGEYSQSIFLPEGKVSWYIATLDENEELKGSGIYVEEENPNLNAALKEKVWSDLTQTPDTESDFYKSISLTDGINTYSLADLDVPSGGAQYTLTIKYPSVSNTGAEDSNKTNLFYIKSKQVSADGKSVVINIRSFVTELKSLEAPIIDLSGFAKSNGTTPKITVGFNPSTVKLKAPSSKTEYIELFGNGVSLGKVDVSTADSEGYCYFKLPTSKLIDWYDLTKNLTDKSVTLEAIAGCSNSKDNILYKNSEKSQEVFLMNGNGREWKFNDNNWKDARDNIGSLEDFMYNGLTLTRGDGSMTAGSDYFQTGGAGSMIKRVFSMKIYEPGIFTIDASNNGGSATAGKNLIIQIGDDPSDPNHKGVYDVGQYPSTSHSAKDYDIRNLYEEKNGTNIYIYSDNNIRIYSIKFAPKQ